MICPILLAASNVGTASAPKKAAFTFSSRTIIGIMPCRSRGMRHGRCPRNVVDEQT